jgi:hypothetical protein
MERTMEEAEYVLAVLQQMRGEVSTNPELFDSDAQERIDQAVSYVQDILLSIRSQLMTPTVEQQIKAA